ncbi:MAG: heat-shock protein [Gemmatales bacterium]|nr:MAG: heat-shock protein [Gemmatales bacterium]
MKDDRKLASGSRFVIGIDLGTTNCALAYADTATDADLIRIEHFSVPQLVAAGEVAERPLLPSFLYLPAGKELPAGSLKLPWGSNEFAVGEFARRQGERVPNRLVSSAKSWLCHPGIDRRGAVLPWQAPPGERRISPLEAATCYLKHLADAWNYRFARKAPELRLEKQEIVLTVPASFDAVARDLTVEAARQAGMENITLLEEPQAAFYAWIDEGKETWREQVEVGDLVLVCDIGGGTTDFTLIEISEEDGNLALDRLAVGEHILLGGDNMDLALAHAAAAKFAEKGTKLDASQMLMLWHACRSAKEALFADPTLPAAPIAILGRGSKVIGSTLKGELRRADVEQVLLEGFFPDCPLHVEPSRQRSLGLQELGLPYVSDPAVSRHLAYFLNRNAEVLASRATKKKDTAKRNVMPTALLFNGGVMKAEPLRQRLVDILKSWSNTDVKTLANPDPDLSVARGAAYYGLVRRGKGVRIRGGTARSYYIGVESSLPAVPGFTPPIKALCVVPFGMEEGTEVDLPDQEFGLIVGEPVEFRFLGSTTRRDDKPGMLIENWEDDIEELSPLLTTLEPTGKDTPHTVPVHLHGKVTETGTLELWCLSRDGKQRWKLEFDVREKRN